MFAAGQYDYSILEVCERLFVNKEIVLAMTSSHFHPCINGQSVREVIWIRDMVIQECYGSKTKGVDFISLK